MNKKSYEATRHNYRAMIQRWSLGSGEYKYEVSENKKVFSVTEPKGESSSFIRAVINPIKGTRYHTSGKKNLYKVTLFMGNGHKDAIHTCTWDDARVIIHTLLQDIDRCLERPVSNFWIPAEDEHVVPRVGDVIVFTKPETSYVGELGVIKEFINKTGSYHIDNGFFYPNQNGDFYANEFEVIDHDPSLLDDPEDLRLEALPKNVSPQVFEEDGWEYWLEKSTDNGLYLNKKCKCCGSLHPKVIRNLS